VSAVVDARRVGVRFLLDRHSRPVTPALARVRRQCGVGWGLRGVDLRIEPGESVAVVGPNGAGKTTLLRAMAGVFEPDEGSVEVRGRIGALLSIEGGLMAQLTGRENAMLLAVLAGLSREAARAALERMKQASGLGAAYERHVSSYSQGMRARLGFSVMEHSEPQVLLLDEVHEALDHEFRQRVEAAARRILRAGGVVVAAGHDHAVLRALCDRAVLLEQGRIVADSGYDEVVGAYLGETAAEAPR
jgi:ABC-type polysaccharide/polyol phosphate transport system ATPase subunit